VTAEEENRGRFWLGAGAVLAGVGVGLGAFGAHGLRPLISADLLLVYETGVRYHLIHALAMIAAGLAVTTYPAGETSFRRAALLFAVGILLFSGSLYVIALTGLPQFGIVTPFGGGAFLLGWAFLAFGAFGRH
jgi:uncharacterized membrane protein YgdD (TMEM256/DUF423 family)